MQTEIAPAILAKSQEELLRKLKAASKHSSRIQIDVLDRSCIPNSSVFLSDFKRKPRLKLEFHLMVSDPLEYLPLISPYAYSAIAHIEYLDDFPAFARACRKAGLKCGIAINPKTDFRKLAPFLKHADYVLVMTVNPGRGGQEFIPSSLLRIRKIRRQFPHLPIEVDGGIRPGTARQAAAAGANILVAGSAYWKRNIKSALKALIGGANRGALEALPGTKSKRAKGRHKLRKQKRERRQSLR